jgi:hypothetical protein
VRFLIFGQYEFDVPDSEESLYLAIATYPEFTWASAPPGTSPRKATRDEQLHAFLEASMRFGDEPKVTWDERPAVEFQSVADKGDLRRYLKRFAGMELLIQDTTPVYVFNDTWDDNQFLIATQRELIWYHWYTTA